MSLLSSNAGVLSLHAQLKLLSKICFLPLRLKNLPSFPFYRCFSLFHANFFPSGILCTIPFTYKIYWHFLRVNKFNIVVIVCFLCPRLFCELSHFSSWEFTFLLFVSNAVLFLSVHLYDNLNYITVLVI